MCSLSLAGAPIRDEGSIDAMGSVSTVVAYGENASQLHAAIAAALNEMSRLDALLSNYKPDSEWSRMNRAAAGRPVTVSRELFDLLAQCMEYSRESDGAFDISVGPLMHVWGFYNASGSMPSQNEIAGAIPFVGYRNIQLDRRALTVRFLKQGVELDPGGIGKGYAVDRMITILRSAGIRSALVSAGGSSIYALGAPPGEDGWRIQLPDPSNAAPPPATICLRDESLSTSGSSEKYFISGGKRWSHIMDPRTGNPARGMLSVSVVAPKTIDSEAWAKPYFILGRAWAEQHKKPDFRIFLCEDVLNNPCTWLE